MKYQQRLFTRAGSLIVLLLCNTLTPVIAIPSEEASFRGDWMTEIERQQTDLGVSEKFDFDVLDEEMRQFLEYAESEVGSVETTLEAKECSPVTAALYRLIGETLAETFLFGPIVMELVAQYCLQINEQSVTIQD